MSYTPSRPSTLAAAAILAFLSGGASRLAGAPVAPLAGQKPPAVMAAGAAVPPEVVERLRKAGLDAKDPNLGGKLKTLAASTGQAFVRSHVMSSTAKSRSATLKRAAVSGGGIGRSPTNLRLASALPVPGVVDGVYDDSQAFLPSPSQISSAHGHTWPGRYFFLVETKKKIAVKGGPTFSIGNIALNYGCSAQLGVNFTTAAAGDDPNFSGEGVPSRPPANGSYYYWVSVDFSELPVGQPRKTQATILFENVAAPVSLLLQPTQGTVTLSVTIDHSPKLTGAGIVYPWGSTGLAGSNAQLGSAGTARVGPGDWQTQTTGDDLVGVGVALGPGWSVVSTKISGAVSAISPQDLSPDNTWRGASVTTPPAGNDLRTAVHWHYSGIDSLDYTVEWTLAGPMGQRPLLTMAKYGSCDQ
jgi:hypothetical protein